MCKKSFHYDDDDDDDDAEEKEVEKQEKREKKKRQQILIGIELLFLLKWFAYSRDVLAPLDDEAMLMRQCVSSKECVANMVSWPRVSTLNSYDDMLPQPRFHPMTCSRLRTT